MSVLIANDFSTYKLTDDEALQGSILTVTQRQVMQIITDRLFQETVSPCHQVRSPE